MPDDETKLERTITEKVTAAAIEAASKLVASEDGDKRPIVVIVPVVVFSNCGIVDGG